MKNRIQKLAASPVLPLESKFQYDNQLLHGQSWPEDVKWLRDTYEDVALLWDELKEPSQDQLLYTRSAPKIDELVVGLSDVTKQVSSWLPLAGRLVRNAHHDYEISVRYAQSKDFSSATLYQTYALTKLHNVLEMLTNASREPSRNRFSSAKKAYGYDISGEIFEGSGELANRENQTNLKDTAQPQDHHETGTNPANTLHDVDADKEFPRLNELKSKRVHWPARSR